MDEKMKAWEVHFHTDQFNAFSGNGLLENGPENHRTMLILRGAESRLPEVYSLPREIRLL